MAEAEAVWIEVAYALPHEQCILKLQVPAGTSLREAVVRSGIRRRFAEIDPDRARLGVFGRLRAGDEPVAAGDRIEIYRELTADPKQLRRERAARRRR